MKTEVNKIVEVNPKGLPPIYVAGTGVGNLIEEFSDDLRERYEQFNEQLKDSKHETDLLFRKSTRLVLSIDRKEIANIALKIFDRVGRNSDMYFQCLIGTSDRLGKTELLLVDAMGTFRKGRDFEAIGSGARSGGYLLLKEFHSPKMSSTEATRLAAFVIDKVGNVDKYVSGHDSMRITYNGKAIKLDEEDYMKRLKEAQQRFAYSRKFWRMRQDDWETFKKSVPKSSAKP